MVAVTEVWMPSWRHRTCQGTSPLDVVRERTVAAMTVILPAAYRVHEHEC